MPLINWLFFYQVIPKNITRGILIGTKCVYIVMMVKLQALIKLHRCHWNDSRHVTAPWTLSRYCYYYFY